MSSLDGGGLDRGVSSESGIRLTVVVSASAGLATPGDRVPESEDFTDFEVIGKLLAVWVTASLTVDAAWREGRRLSGPLSPLAGEGELEGGVPGESAAPEDFVPLRDTSRLPFDNSLLARLGRLDLPSTFEGDFAREPLGFGEPEVF